MVDPVVIMLDDMVEEDSFALSLAKRKYEIELFDLWDDEPLDALPIIYNEGTGIPPIGRHGYTGMGDYYSNTHGNTGMGWF